MQTDVPISGRERDALPKPILQGLRVNAEGQQGNRPKAGYR